MADEPGNQTANPIITPDGEKAVYEFFSRMGRYCAARDFDSTEILFASDVVSFGTKASVVKSLSQLRSEQWEMIWPTIEGFEMQLDDLQCSAQSDLAWGMLPWTSLAKDKNNKVYHRPGRATAVLERRDGIWLCVHTHFSLVPASG